MGGFTIQINAQKCKGCGLCVSVCPKKILTMGKQVNSKGYSPAAITDEAACVGCTSCALMCPDGAIAIYAIEEGDR